MEQTNSIKQSNDFVQEINISEIFYALLDGKWIIISVTAFMSITALFFSLMLPNIYESEALLVPTDISGSISRSSSGYVSLAGLTGANLPLNDNEVNSSKAVEKITSLSFFENNILTNINLPNLMAFKNWNSQTNTLIYDKNIYDIKSNTWIRDFSYPQQQIPSAQESYEVFMKEHFSLSQDNKTGFITVSIKHQSPFIAKKWNEIIVTEINNFYRLKDKLESEKAANYLNQQIIQTNLSEIKEALAQLLQEQIKKLTLIEANEFYVFDYIDPPAVMEKKSSPKRALICILGALIGGMLSFLYVLIRFYVSK